MPDDALTPCVRACVGDASWRGKSASRRAAREALTFLALLIPLGLA